MNSSQLVDIDFKVYQAWKRRKLKQTTIFLETMGETRRETGPERKRERLALGVNNCTYCKGKGY